MNILTIINLVSNIIICSSVFMFIISVFGRADHPIWETKWKAYLAKVGLCISGCGALLNIVNLSTPILSEIVLNVGLSLNFLWISLWQYHEMRKASIRNKLKAELAAKRFDGKKQPKSKPVK
jgi:hypothetical protein